MLISGMVIMYETQAFWGLEDNPNAATINGTFSTVTNLVPVLIVIVIVILEIRLLNVQKILVMVC